MSIGPLCPGAVADLEVEVDARAAAEHLARSLTFRTVSPPPPTPHDSSAFRALHDHFAGTYPEHHAALERETVSGLSFLYAWEGADPRLPPAVLMGHLDVVPVTPGVVNFRILPGETVETVRERKIRVIDDDRIEVEIYDAARDPSPVSDTDSPAFRLVDRTLRDVVPGDGLVVAPSYLVFGGTDATHYGDRSRSVCRLLPVRVEAGDLGRVHGTDERISVEGFRMAVRYFHRLLRNLEEL